jgi:AcrR family transcriptional regulator
MPKKPKKPQKRRTAEEARRAILDAAEHRLGEVGPDGLRLQQIARDVGVSHPAILHHFGSREELVKAVVQRAIEGLEAETVRAFAGGTGAPPSLEIIERTYDVLVDKGYARLVAWVLLSGHRIEPSNRLRIVAEVAHARRKAGGGTAPFEDTLFRALLVALVTFGEAVAGPAMRASAGLDDDPASARRFREWLASVVIPPEP